MPVVHENCAGTLAVKSWGKGNVGGPPDLARDLVAHLEQHVKTVLNVECIHRAVQARQGKARQGCKQWSTAVAGAGPGAGAGAEANCTPEG